jgi:hypothetical protein
MKKGEMNPNGVSKDRPDEIFLEWHERGAQILPSGYTVGQSFGALRRLWKKFISYRYHFNVEMQRVTASRIQDIERELGIAVAIFPDLGLYSTDDELPLDQEHTWEEVKALHDRLEEEGEQEQEQEQEDIVLDDKHWRRRDKNKDRKSCEYYRYG